MKELSLHITDLCNFACAFCVWGDSLCRRDDPVEWSGLEAFLTEHRGEGFEWVNLHGGEPTLRRDLFRLLALIRLLGYPNVSLQTNGWALANRRFTERLAEGGVSLVVISLHGATAGVHDGLVGAPGSLARLLRGMDHLAALGIAMRTNTVITRENLSELPAIADLAVGHGAREVNLSSLMPSGRAWSGAETPAPSFRAVRGPVAAAVRRAEEGGARVTLEGFPFCAAPHLEDRCLHRDGATGDQITCFIHGSVWANHDTHVERSLKSKRSQCRQCRYDERCPGVYTLYAHARGWEEFQPVAPSS
jgi:MoaA/NifB/PqqE/SkfB family radical SAM enzyme